MKKLIYILLFVPVALFGQDNYSLDFNRDDATFSNQNDNIVLSDISDNSAFINLSNGYTFECWINLRGYGWTGNSTAHAYIISGIANGLLINGNNILHWAFSGTDGTIHRLETPYEFPLNEWRHISISYENNYAYLFDNGELVDSEYIPSGLELNWSADNGFSIGIAHWNNGWWHPIDGKIDNIRISNYARYKNTFCPNLNYSVDENTLLMWDFNQINGDSVNDLSPNNFNGLLYSATYSEDIPEQTCSILDQLYLSFDAWNISIDLSAGWNMFGYGCPSSIDITEGLSNHTESISITKDNNGNVYMPEFSFNGIGDLTPGFGYQIKLTEAIEGFSLCDWYVNDIPEDNIVSLQEENASLQAELDSLYSLYSFGCMDSTACNYDINHIYDDHSCIYPIQGYDCSGNLSAEVGDVALGGIIFYVDDSGEHGLVAAIEDLEGTYEWGCYTTDVNGADQLLIGDGYSNSLDIFNQGCTTFYGDLSAAHAALNLFSEGYNDWYLPSRDELELMYNSIGGGGPLGNVGFFYPEYYWSSSEWGPNDSWYVNFEDGTVDYIHPPINKKDLIRVRPIRSF